MYARSAKERKIKSSYQIQKTKTII